jgi:hypothetical protein
MLIDIEELKRIHEEKNRPHYPLSKITANIDGGPQLTPDEFKTKLKEARSLLKKGKLEESRLLYVQTVNFGWTYDVTQRGIVGLLAIAYQGFAAGNKETAMKAMFALQSERNLMERSQGVPVRLKKLCLHANRKTEEAYYKAL